MMRAQTNILTAVNRPLRESLGSLILAGQPSRRSLGALLHLQLYAAKTRHQIEGGAVDFNRLNRRPTGQSLTPSPGVLRAGELLGVIERGPEIPGIAAIADERQQRVAVARMPGETRLRLKSNRLRRFRAEPFLFPQLSDLHLRLEASKSTTTLIGHRPSAGLPQTRLSGALSRAPLIFFGICRQATFRGRRSDDDQRLRAANELPSNRRDVRLFHAGCLMPRGG
jgi:hypothetical protein